MPSLLVQSKPLSFDILTGGADRELQVIGFFESRIAELSGGCGTSCDCNIYRILPLLWKSIYFVTRSRETGARMNVLRALLYCTRLIEMFSRCKYLVNRRWIISWWHKIKSDEGGGSAPSGLTEMLNSSMHVHIYTGWSKIIDISVCLYWHLKKCLPVLGSAIGHFRDK